MESAGSFEVLTVDELDQVAGAWGWENSGGGAIHDANMRSQEPRVVTPDNQHRVG